MRGNTFGQVFCLHTFGESHGPALGAVIDGCPAGVRWQQEMLEEFLRRRRPGGELVSGRQETDEVEILSGVYQDLTLGTPIAMIIRNRDARSQDYSFELVQQRQGHATDLWREKYGHADERGSGRASGRETVSRVLGGAVARMLVQQLYPEAALVSFVSRIGPLALSEERCQSLVRELVVQPWEVDRFQVRCPDAELDNQMKSLLLKAKEEGESYGGTAFLHMVGWPRGLGQPVFHKLKADLAAAYLSVGATVGVEIGEGFLSSQSAGHEFHHHQQDYGGIRGGLSTGEPITIKVAFKPTSTRQEMARQGRHDPCIVPRALPVLEAMTWLVWADHLLMARLDRV